METKDYKKRWFFGRMVSKTTSERKTPKRWRDMSEQERIAAIEYYMEETFTEEQNDNN